MSHHPSSAELAAFRRTFIPPHMVDSMHPSDGGAIKGWPNELRDGIGYRESDPVAMCIVRADGARHTGSVARERASALRSRAYARMDYCACQHPDRHYGNQPCRVTPASAGIPLGPNGYCWSCWSAKHDQPVPTDTWTDDEPRSPLPIRYQPSFIITR